MAYNRLYPDHPIDHDLRALKQIENSIEAQLEHEHQVTERDRREIELARCFPQGKLILRGQLGQVFHTIDPEVTRAFLLQDGKKKGVLYINELRKVCVALDWYD